ncbi:MAG: hypothetical protein IPP46_12735 [Bacteroidetes bacterium]|nr:hypothetical protein [Bacteroidota bacterium]
MSRILSSYNIRAMEVNEYMSFTDGLCRAASTAYSGIHLIVIDGIADFIYDVNDSEQSKCYCQILSKVLLSSTRLPSLQLYIQTQTATKSAVIWVVASKKV